MAFPADRLAHRLQAAFGADVDTDPSTWTWTDITADIHAQQVTINRGQANEASAAQPTSISLTLDNQHGNYTPDNPLSTYYPNVDLGVPLRYSVEGATPYLELDGPGRAATPDAAPLDVTGDIDVRLDATLDAWAGQGTFRELAGKYVIAGDQRSWLLLTSPDGHLTFRWSPDGVTIPSPSSTVPLSVPGSGRLAVRATLDVDNGEGGHTVTFYTAPSLAGPWSQLGDPFTGAGASAVFASSAPLHVGDVGGIGFQTPSGQLHGFELRDGINGTVVADPDFGVQEPGATSFEDSAGRTWTLQGSAEITPWQHRFIGHATSWEPAWPYGDLSNEDTGYQGESQVDVRASGVLQRLGQGESELASTLRRRIPSFAPLAYWPMEDGQSATQAYSPIEGVSPLTLTHANWGSVDSLASSRALPALASSGSDLPMMHGTVPAPASALTSWSVQYVYRLDSIPSALRTFLRIRTSGTVAEWYIQSQDNLSRLLGRDEDGATIVDHPIGTGNDLFNQWMLVEFRATQNGGNVDWVLRWTDVGGDAGAVNGSVAGTLGRPIGVASPPDGYSPLLDGMAIGHISVWPTATTTAYLGAIDAWAGETAGARMVRLCQEEGVPLAVVGDTADTQPVGPQRPATLLALLAEAAAVDGGMLGEQRSARGLRYRTRASLYNQAPALVLDASANEITNPFSPVLDDQRIRNDVLVSRDGGSAAPAVDDASVARHGRYDEQITVNAYTDEQLPGLAGWRLHLGTWPGMRYPAVTTELAIAPQLIAQWLTLNDGDRVQVRNLPRPQHPVDTVDLILRGYSETLSPTRWTVTGNTTPAGPWQTGVTGINSGEPAGGTSGEVARVDTDGTQLADAAGADDTTLYVVVTDGPLWITATPVMNPNPDFEAALDGWTGFGCTLARVPTPQSAPVDGAWSLELTPDGIAEFPNAGSDQVPVIEGLQYTVSGWLRCTTTRSVALNLNWFTGGSYLSTSSNDQPVEAEVWTYFELTATAPATATTANLAPTVPDFPPPEDVLICDQLTLRPALVGALPAEFPFAVKFGGEVARVTAIEPRLLNTNPQIVVDTAGWTGEDATISRSTAQVHPDGIASLFIEPDGVASAGGARSDQSATGTVTSGASYTAALWAYTAGGWSDLGPAVSWYDAGGAFLSADFGGTAVSAGVWTLVEATFTAPASASRAVIRARHGDTPSLADTWYAWDIRLTADAEQAFTVTRSINGVSKPHAAGADLRLAQPTIVAL
ncbi:hypothetical protein U9R90_24915 [Streptomyces sp. E11-3]|uniref:hypothetical protein n=1 Tax=Streptomyces sp. E11-3 TaxID=3110112 RepID=UPI003981446E